MSFLTLPEEVLRGILELFVVPPDTANTYPDTYSNPKEEWIQRRNDLYQLTLTSRDISRLATQFIYQSIFIFDSPQMVYLLRSLVENEQLGTYVRTLAMLGRLEYDKLQEEAADVFNEVNWRAISTYRAQQFLPVCIHEDWLDAQDVAEGPDNMDELLECTLAFILCMAPRLQTLYMVIPASNCTEYYSLMRCLDAIYDEEVLRSGFLSSLAEIVLAADHGSSGTRMNMGLLARLMRFSAVRQLEIFGDQLYADIGTIQEVSGLEVLSSLEEIKLDCSFTLGKGWDMLCRLCPKLKLVEMWPSAYSRDYGGDAAECNLNTGFLRRANTLQSLRINSSIDEGFLEELGPDNRLSCLPHLINLTELTVELLVLYGHPKNLPPAMSPDQSELGHPMDLQTILPPSIRRLEIDAEWDLSVLEDYWNADMKKMYAHSLTNMLIELVEGSKAKLPQLSHVTLKNSQIFTVQGDYRSTLLKHLVHHTRDDGSVTLSSSQSTLRPEVQPMVLEIVS